MKKMDNRIKRTYSKMGYAKYQLTNRPTKAELVFKQYLDEFGIPYRFQKGVVTSKKRKAVRVVDFYVARVKIVFEIDGSYHESSYQQIADFKREQEIGVKIKNVLFVRFSNKEVIENPERVKKIVKEVYNERLWDYMNNKRIGEKAKERYKFIFSN